MLGETGFFLDLGCDDPQETPCAAAAVAAPGTAVALIIASTWWAFPARLALACRARGFTVRAVCGPDHPLGKTAAVDEVFSYHALRPLAALRAAIARSGATLLLPCDDRARLHLHRLHASSGDGALRSLIESSLGDPAWFAAAERRADVMALARAAGIAAPLTLPLAAIEDIPAAIARTGLPAAVKVDGTWGGYGVAIVRSIAEAEAAFRRLSRPLSLARGVKRLLADRDAFDLPSVFSREKPRLSLQAFVPGRPANSLSVCRNGVVLTTLCAEALAVQRPLGAATAVRVLEHDGMRRAAASLAARLGISGFMGLDFLLDDSGQAHLVEMNARATPLAHFGLGALGDPVGALARIAGLPVRTPAPLRPPGGGIAYFPQAWHSDPGSTLLRDCHHDVPWEDPALVHELLRQPRPDRGLLARALRRLRKQGPP